MKNKFEKCCFDYDLVRKASQCDRINCLEHESKFSVYYHKVNNDYCYCLNHIQLGEYWRCVLNDRDYFCSNSCEKCMICKEVSHIFSELPDGYFFDQIKVLTV